MNTPNPPATIDRRKVLKYGAGFGLALAWPNSRVLGANDDIRIGVVGVNGRGQAHISAFEKMKGVRLTALCDADPTVLDARVTASSDRQKISVKGFIDMREMFEGGDIDAMATATPNHWHTLSGVWAIQAGKDAYIEKPISHNVWEGRQLVKLARKEGRICQGGTQSRALGSIQAAVKWVQDGNLGKIKYVKGMCYKARQSIGKGGNGTIPDGVNYDLWSGPAELELPLRRQKFHYDWHWFYAYGNGDMG
ncbi:MAG TPA: Gfo/Idh/MocA family oxidoreductase, partial [Bacteroidia bacterium]|nr:Gfo/Idh/MocA family oxidoreductase [Bacteroidia bacterium]